MILCICFNRLNERNTIVKSNLQFEQVEKPAYADLEIGSNWFLLVGMKSSPKLHFLCLNFKLDILYMFLDHFDKGNTIVIDGA